MSPSIVTPQMLNQAAATYDIRQYVDMAIKAQTTFSEVNPIATLHGLSQLIQKGAFPTFEILLPLAFKFQNKPLTLEQHFPLSPLFNTDRPERIVVIAGRQLGKSVSLMALAILLTSVIPGFRTLVMTPLSEQARRLSVNYANDMLNQSPIRSLWRDNHSTNSVVQKGFVNAAYLLFSYFGQNCDRIRGIASDFNLIDEYQDIDGDHLPIVGETLSASRWKLQMMTGTPKTLDNPIQKAWRRSSQAEWIIRCGCGRWNIPSLEFDLERMIGPLRDDISLERPGVICVKCSKPLDPRPATRGGGGRWKHRFPERASEFSGYHIPQIIMPGHYGDFRSWRNLHGKMNGADNFSRAKFYNEVLGEGVDMGQRLVSETDLRRAANLPWVNNPQDPSREMLKRLQHYKYRCLAVDWSGGGMQELSFTVLALLGLRTSGVVDVLWGKRLLLSREHFDEAIECYHWFQRFNCHIFAHDHSGAGSLRTSLMLNIGLSPNKFFSADLMPPRTKLCVYVKPNEIDRYGHYQLNKTHSLLTTFGAIKSGQLNFFAYDDHGESNPGLLRDFLQLIEDKTPTSAGSSIYRILNPGDAPDDFAEAVNIGAAALWHTSQSWPNFSKVLERWTPNKATADAYESEKPPWSV